MAKTQTNLAEKVRHAITIITATQGFPPSVRQLAQVLGVGRSKTHYVLRLEEAAGRVKHDPGSYRSWRVVDPANA